VGVTYVTWPYNFWHTIEHISKTAWARDFEFGRQLSIGNAEHTYK